MTIQVEPGVKRSFSGRDVSLFHNDTKISERVVSAHLKSLYANQIL